MRREKSDQERLEGQKDRAKTEWWLLGCYEMQKLYVGGAVSREARQGLRTAGHGEGLSGERKKEGSGWTPLGAT